MRRVIMSGDRRDAVPPVLLTVVGAVLFGAVYFLTVRTVSGRLFGDASLRGAELTNSSAAGLVDSVLGVISVVSLLAGIAAVALIALVRLRRFLGLAAIGVLLVANAATYLLKRIVLQRPDFGLDEVSPATHNSLPSGHVTAAFSVVVAVLFVVPPRWRRPVGAVGGAATAVVAVAAMSAGWHRAGDAVSAMLLVAALAGIAGVVVLIAGGGTPNRAPQRAAGWWRWVGRIGVGCLLLGVVLAVVLGLWDSVRTSATGQTLAFLGGGLIIVATAVGTVVAVVATLDRIASDEARPAAPVRALDSLPGS